MKNFFYDQVNVIQDASIKKFVLAVLDNAPNQFFLVPSSSTGKYHPPEDQGESGLLRHSIKCARISLDLASFYNIEDWEKDVVYAASLLHDIQKNGMPWKDNTDYAHGKIAYDWLSQFTSLSIHSFYIRQCIRFHMGRWVAPKEEVERALHPSMLELIVQLADYLSSRKDISFLPDMDVSVKNIRNYGVRGIRKQ